MLSNEILMLKHVSKNVLKRARYQSVGTASVLTNATAPVLLWDIAAKLLCATSSYPETSQRTFSALRAISKIGYEPIAISVDPRCSALMAIATVALKDPRSARRCIGGWRPCNLDGVLSFGCVLLHRCARHATKGRGCTKIWPWSGRRRSALLGGLCRLLLYSTRHRYPDTARWYLWRRSIIFL